MLSHNAKIFIVFVLFSTMGVVIGLRRIWIFLLYINFRFVQTSTLYNIIIFFLLSFFYRMNFQSAQDCKVPMIGACFFKH